MHKQVDSVEVSVVHPTNEIAPSLVSTFKKGDRRTDLLMDVLHKCHSADPLKFKPKYQLTVNYADNSQQVLMVLGNHVKIEGVTNQCSTNLEELIDKLRSQSG